MFRTMFTYISYSQTVKSPKRVHKLINIVQQCPRVTQDKDEPKRPRWKRTGHRHGKQKNSSKPSRRDNGSIHSPRPLIRSKRTVQSENFGEGAKTFRLEQVGFQAVTCDSKVYRIQNLRKMPLSHKQKNKKFLSRIPQWNSLCHAIRSGNFQHSAAADKHIISPSSACTLHRNDLSHHQVLVCTPWTNPTLRSRLMGISLNLKYSVSPSLGFSNPGMCRMGLRRLTNIWMKRARSSMCRTRRSSPSMELIEIAAVTSLRRTNWYVPVVHREVPRIVEGIPSKIDSKSIASDTHFFEFVS